MEPINFFDMIPGQMWTLSEAMVEMEKTKSYITLNFCCNHIRGVSAASIFVETTVCHKKLMLGIVQIPV